MRTDFHEDDAKRIWQNQPEEVSKVSTVLIRQKSRELRARTRRQLFDSLVAPFVVVFFYVFAMTHMKSPGWVTHFLFVVALVWSISGVYWLNRGGWGRGLPRDLGLQNGIAFCRLELKRQRSYVRRALLWSFVPIVLAMGAFILTIFDITGIAFFSRAIPFLVLVLLWIPSYLYLRSKRQQHGVQRELDEFADLSDNDKEEKKL